VLRSVWFFATKIAAPEQTDFRKSGNDVLGSKVVFEGVRTVNASLLQSFDVFTIAITKTLGVMQTQHMEICKTKRINEDE